MRENPEDKIWMDYRIVRYIHEIPIEGYPDQVFYQLCEVYFRNGIPVSWLNDKNPVIFAETPEILVQCVEDMREGAKHPPLMWDDAQRRLIEVPKEVIEADRAADVARTEEAWTRWKEANSGQSEEE